ncbi:MAG: DUF1890 family protein [Candidatus Methanogasteraceae archaeon]|uniref:DUF1890 domain-containing protein n=1 Tax=Candidatus Methanogaster sp. ANME-2c ERB4 TaxID=2759911 RepID=A0A7G9YM35_9EURY|nr:hypothetical protein GBBPNFKJ_00011 [Methanosarcinales archaeon ANME-2c ERB4]QNO49069.1 hypothetical protein FFEDGKNF_00024 [Methanosarcinales archaeon ANME-2c ERB4]
MPIPNGLTDALIVLGCPESSVQTAITLYLANKLKKEKIRVVVAGTRSAVNLIKVSDFERNYVDETVDLDRCIEDLAEKRIDFDLCFVFVHKDAGISYLATMHSISDAQLFAIVSGGDAEAFESMIDFECEKIVAKTSHNPIPLKKRIDQVITWDV